MKPLYFFFSIFFFSTCLIAQKTAILKDASVSFVFVSKDVDGHIGGFQSNSVIDLDNISGSNFEGSVRVETIKTGIFLRDWSIKGRKYFDKDKYPTIHFKSDTVKLQGDKIIITGQLTIKKTTKTIDIAFSRENNQWMGTTSLYSSDFGINIKKKREDNLVRVSLTFTQQ
ncbi:YceI family protein [Spongiimicrobium sp. 3-5]|uniref:YceI family protein n=1 Tax=Spongiimicrobium sp. 3-5 TaxID=3332596 RepID=UPI00398074C5